MAATPASFRPKLSRFSTPATPNECNSQFKATHLWNDIVEHLKKNIPTKRRKIKGHTYYFTFTGSDAVDTVLRALQDDSINYQVKDVSREKAAKLCQSFLENHVLEFLGSKNCDHKLTFEDCAGRYYRFHIEDWDDELDEISDSGSYKHDDVFRVNYGFEDSSDCISLSDTPVSKSLHLAELLRLSGSKLTRRSGSLSDVMRRDVIKRSNMSPKSLFNKRASSSADLSDLASMDSDDVLREIALSKLLIMIDLPLLDALLQDSCKNKSHWTNVSQSACSGQALLLDCYRDDWTRTALDCIALMPKGQKIVDDYLAESNEIVQKLKIYHGVVCYYMALGEPIVPQGFAEVMVTVLNFIMQGRDDLAVRALQLTMILLPLACCQHLEKLIYFMRAVCNEHKIAIDNEFSNRTALERLLTSSVIRAEILSEAQCRQIVLYLLDNCQRVFSVPNDVRVLADKRILAIKCGKLDPILEAPELILQTSFCDRVSKADYEEQSGPGTDTELVKLVNFILDDTKLSLKEKKHRLKQFQKHHPKLFGEHFSEYL